MIIETRTVYNLLGLFDGDDDGVDDDLDFNNFLFHCLNVRNIDSAITVWYMPDTYDFLIEA